MFFFRIKTGYHEDKEESEEENIDDESVDIPDDENEKDVPTVPEVLQALSVCQTFMERHWEFDREDLIALRHMRDQALYIHDFTLYQYNV